MESRTKGKLRCDSEVSAKHINTMKNRDRDVFKKGKNKVGDIEVTDGIIIKEEVEEEEENVDLAQSKLSNYVPKEFADIDNCDLKEEHEDSVQCKIEEVFLYNEQEQQRESEYSSDDSSVKTKPGKNPTIKRPHRKQLKHQHSNSHTTTNPDGVVDHGQPSVSGYSGKRQKHVEQWKRVEAKWKRNCGDAYVSSTTKQPVAARVVGPPCACGCFNNIGMDKIKVIFYNYWALGNYNEQTAYLARLVSAVDVKRCRVKGRHSRIQRRIKYTVIYDNFVYTVCSKAFYSIHSVTEKRIRTVLAKQTANGTVEPDRRGMRHSVSKISKERRETVHEHLNSVMKVSGHNNSSQSPHRKYIPSGLNIKILYTMYCEWMKDTHEDIQPVSNRYYYEVFKQDLIVGFKPSIPTQQ